MKSIWFLLLSVAAYDLVPFQGRDRHNNHSRWATPEDVMLGLRRQKAVATSSLKGVALVPSANDDVAEALDARDRFQRGGSYVEFVHIHKCGGQTFNRVIPDLLCGEHGTVMKTCKDPTCCLVRPPGPFPEALKETNGSTLKFASAHEEFSAYAMPWTNRTLKATMVRRPFERWVSELQYSCRTRDSPILRVSEALGSSSLEHSTKRNRIAQGLIPPVVLGDARLTGDHLTGVQFDAAVAALRSFAFIGVLEHYDRSVCLFARTFAPSRVCDVCCDHVPGIPRINIANNDTRCNAGHLLASPDDRRLYDAIHTADQQVFGIARAIFEKRWELANAQAWGNDPIGCACNFLDNTNSSFSVASSSSSRHHHRMHSLL